jgi:GLPGLI family protein
MKLKLFLQALFFVPLFAYSRDMPGNDATIRVHYVFTQKEKAGEKPFRNDTMTLDIGSQVSYYYDETKSLKDSVFNQVFSGLSPDRIKSISVFRNSDELSDNYLGDRYETNYFDGTSEKIYKNRMTGQLSIVNRISNNDYLCEDPLGTLSWEITSDTATVLNYNCQKAKLHFRGRDYEAWFAPEIPVNDGPWKFISLPGLILKVKDIKELVVFDCIGLQNLETPAPIEIPNKKYLKCNRKEMAKMIKERGASMTFGINGGNVVIANKALDSSFQFLELE